jgi:hypothetical protein
LPEGPGPFRLVQLLAGGSWTSVEHPFEPDHPTCKLVEALIRAGYATLRVERSGIGDSEGPLCTETDLSCEIAGAAAGLAASRQQPFVEAGRTVLFGHSIGGMIAPLIADDSVEAAIGFGTSARRWHDALLASSRRQAELNGLSGVELELHMGRLTKLQELVIAGDSTPERAFIEHPELRELPQPVLEWYRGTKAFGRSVAFHQQLTRTDLASAWRDFARPVLALIGEHDWIATFEDACEIVDCAAHELSGAFEVPETDHHMKRRASRRESLEAPGAGQFSAAIGEMAIAWMGQAVRRK